MNGPAAGGTPRRSVAIRNGSVLRRRPDGRLGCAVEDVWIVDGEIKSVGDEIDDPAASSIDAADQLVIPGLVNCHLHSSETLLRGRYEQLPLDAWGLYVYPILGAPLPSPREVYLRTALAGAEALMSGVTAVLDDVADGIGIGGGEQFEEVVHAYRDLGLRAGCSAHVMDRHLDETLPFADQAIAGELREQLAATPVPSVDRYREFVEEAVRRFHDPDGLIRMVVAPVAPQWCSREMLLTAAELAEGHDLNFHIHVLESKVQAVTAQEHFSGSLVAYLNELGVLDRRVTFAHAVWLDERELDLLADSGAAVAHNPLANLKLGTGIMPFREMLDRGIPVGIGTDGIATNDSPRLFDSMRAAAQLHCVTESDPARWPSAEEIVTAATSGGARAAYMEGATGSVEPGMRADLAILRGDALSLVPLNDPCRQLVHCESGSSVETVLVDGRVVVENGRPVGIDLDDLVAEVRELMPEVERRQAEVERRHRPFERGLVQLHELCNAIDVGIDRYAFGKPPQATGGAPMEGLG